MSFCTKCGSFYSEPGTCNCYAERPVVINTSTTDIHVCELDPDSTARACRHCGRSIPYWHGDTITTAPVPHTLTGNARTIVVNEGTDADRAALSERTARAMRDAMDRGERVP